ncbi:MAG: DedA family protein [Corynebacterium sp.]|nr:DedA family protein [Corynebacterium sp.]
MLDPGTLLSTFGLLGIFVIVFMETGVLIGFIFPGDTLLLSAGIAAHSDNPIANIWVLCIGIPLAAMLGDQLGYTIGKRVGPRIIHTRVMRWIGPEAVEKTNHFFDRYGAFTVLIARFIAVVRTITPVMAGFTGMNRRMFTLYSVIGSIAWGCSFTLIGYWLGEIPLVREYADVVMYIAIGIVLAIIAFQIFQTWRRTKQPR